MITMRPLILVVAIAACGVAPQELPPAGDTLHLMLCDDNGVCENPGTIVMQRSYPDGPVFVTEDVSTYFGVDVTAAPDDLSPFVASWVIDCKKTNIDNVIGCTASK